MKIKHILVILILMFIFLTGCTINTDELSISTSIYPVYDIVKAIVKDKIPIYMTVSTGIDTHSYDPSVDNIIKVKKSTLFIYVSDELESWANGLKEEDENHFVLNLSKNENIDLLVHDEDEEEHDHELHHHHEYDPHIWTSPKNLIYIVEDIYNMVIKIDSANKDYYETNKNNYINELNKIINDYNEFKETASNTTFYFAAPFSLGYLFRDFDLKYYTIYDTCETEIEPSIDKIIKLKKIIIDNNVKYLYVKELSSTKIAESIVSDTNTKILLLHSGHNLSSIDFKNGKTLIEIMYENLENLKKGVS